MSSDIEEQELILEFVVESREDLELFERHIVALEQDPTSRDLADSAFRALHTMKGTCAFFGFDRLEAVSHLGESVLVHHREDTAVFAATTATALLRLADTLRSLLDGIEQSGREPDLDTTDVEAGLRACLVAPAPDTAPRQRFGETLVAAGAVTPAEVAWAVSQQAGGDPRPIGAILLEAGLVDQTQIESVLTLQGRGGPDTTVRVDVEVLDGLVQLVGELARTRDAVVSLVPAELADRLDRVAHALRVSVLRTRVEPVDRSWSSLPRLVRDLAEESGKQVLLRTEGGDTPIDRTLLAAVKDPITHLVRNAVGHGIEVPRQRLSAGKAAEGTLTVRAHSDADEVVIEIADDGRGIDVARVGQTAVARGLLTDAELAAMSVDEVVLLVLRPGFSTAARVTNLSGRGVGLDVVRHDVERVGGRIEILSTPGRGCSLRLHLPHADGTTR